ncbi:hypothetical protein U9M48_040109 [Paspalum notatum var. saurae]|uniref:Uncharacterized protein n=1 Tax=Paspalum notatum var. saurae TaxID=547442 RepID=A0AAQ3UL20_PASNO
MACHGPRCPIGTPCSPPSSARTHEADGHQVTHDVGLPPSVDGQSEAANKVIVMYLRRLTGDRPRRWLQWLPWAEYVFNTAYQSSLRDTPFRVVYGRDPPSIRSYEPGDTRVAAVARTMAEREEFLADVRHRPERRRLSRRSTTTRRIATSPIGWAIGCFSASATAPRRPWALLVPAS